MAVVAVQSSCWWSGAQYWLLHRHPMEQFAQHRPVRSVRSVAFAATPVAQWCHSTDEELAQVQPICDYRFELELTDG